jgi:hypothetical protein
MPSKKRLTVKSYSGYGVSMKRKNKGKWAFSLSVDVYEYYKDMADKSDIPVSQIVDAFLRKCMEEGNPYDQRRVADITVGELLDIIGKCERYKAGYQAKKDGEIS